MEYFIGAISAVVFIIAYGYFDYFVTQKPAREMIEKASKDSISGKITQVEFEKINKQWLSMKFGDRG